MISASSAVLPGLVPASSSVLNQSISLLGVKKGDRFVVNLVIVSPRVTTPEGADMSSYIKVAPAADAKP